MYRVYLPICVHIIVHVIPSIYFVMFIVAEIVLQASDEAQVIE